MNRAAWLAAAGGCAALAFTHGAHAIDTKTQCILAADDGQTLRDQGKYRQARASFTTCSSARCPKNVERACIQWAKELGEAIPTVVLGAWDENGADITNVSVKVDGAPATNRLPSTPIPLDPGEHLFRFERPGGAPVEARVDLRPGVKNRLVAVVLAPVGVQSEAPVAPVQAEAPAQPQVRVPQQPPVQPEGPPVQPPASASVQSEGVAKEAKTLANPATGARGEGLFSARNVTVVSVALGAVAAGAVGGYFLMHATSESATAAMLRDGLSPAQCSLFGTSYICQQLSDAVNAQHRDTDIGVGMLIGSGVLAVAALTTFFAWPRAGEASASEAGMGIRWFAPIVATTNGGVMGVAGGAF